MDDIVYDEENMLPEHYLIERIYEILREPAFEGMSAVTVVGALHQAAFEIQMTPLKDEIDSMGDEGEEWKNEDPPES